MRQAINGLPTIDSRYATASKFVMEDLPVAKILPKSPYSLHPAMAMVQNSIANFKEKTGRTLEQWIAVIQKDGPDDLKACKAWLKAQHGLGTNHASWLAQKALGKDLGLADDDPESYMRLAPQYVEKMFSGAKAALRPIYDEMLGIGLALADDVKACPCSTMVPFYRQHVFANLKPSTNSRLDLGLALKDTKTPKRLIDTGGFAKKDRITRRIALTSVEEIDDEVKHWLKVAYEMDA
jgi:hypothetical protein